MTDCEDLYNARIRAALEGNYTTWTSEWLVLYTEFSGNYDVTIWSINEDQNKFMVRESYTQGYAAILNLVTGAIITLYTNQKHFGWGADRPTSRGKYVALIENVSSALTLKIFQDCVLIQSIDLTSLYGWNATDLIAISFSYDGRYIFLFNTNTHYGALLKGT